MKKMEWNLSGVDVPFRPEADARCLQLTAGKQPLTMR